MDDHAVPDGIALRSAGVDGLRPWTVGRQRVDSGQHSNFKAARRAALFATPQRVNHLTACRPPPRRNASVYGSTSRRATKPLVRSISQPKSQLPLA